MMLRRSLLKAILASPLALLLGKKSGEQLTKTKHPLPPHAIQMMAEGGYLPGENDILRDLPIYPADHPIGNHRGIGATPSFHMEKNLFRDLVAEYSRGLSTSRQT